MNKYLPMIIEAPMLVIFIAMLAIVWSSVASAEQATPEDKVTGVGHIDGTVVDVIDCSDPKSAADHPDNCMAASDATVTWPSAADYSAQYDAIRYGPDATQFNAIAPASGNP